MYEDGITSNFFAQRVFSFHSGQIGESFVQHCRSSCDGLDSIYFSTKQRRTGDNGIVTNVAPTAFSLFPSSVSAPYRKKTRLRRVCKGTLRRRRCVRHRVITFRAFTERFHANLFIRIVVKLARMRSSIRLYIPRTPHNNRKLDIEADTTFQYLGL